MKILSKSYLKKLLKNSNNILNYITIINDNEPYCIYHLKELDIVVQLDKKKNIIHLWTNNGRLGVWSNFEEENLIVSYLNWE